MSGSLLAHLRRNVVAYVALFTALGGTSYAAVRLKPGSVTSAAIARGAVTHGKLAGHSVTSANVKPGSLRSSDFMPGVLTASSSGAVGTKGDPGSPGAPGPAGGATVTMRTHSTGAVTAPHGTSTAVPLAADGWTQAAGELNLIAGTITVHVPSACTGSFGNALIVSVDGAPATVGLVPTAPASKTVTIPIAVGTLMDSAKQTTHRLTAAVANSCTKDGEDFGVSDMSLDVVRVP
jgi:hypothetical protein